MNNKNTIIGLGLIFAIFIGYTYLISPSKDELITQKRRADSMYMVNVQKQHALISAVAREKAIAVAKEKEKFIARGEKVDSATLVRMTLKGELGVFANAAVGKDTTFTVENDVFKLNFISRGGKIGRVELKDYLTWDKKPLILMNSDSLNFGISFYSNNRTISTNRLYFKPFWPDPAHKGQATMKVSGKDSLQFGMRLFTSSNDTVFNKDQYIEFLYTIKGNDNMLRYQINFIGMDQAIDAGNKFLVLTWSDNLKSLEKSLKMERMTSTLYYKYDQDKVDYITETKDEDRYLKNEKIKWFSFKQQFFSLSLIHI